MFKRAYIDARDRVYVHDRPDAQLDLTQLAQWFGEYHDKRPSNAQPIEPIRVLTRSFHQSTANYVVYSRRPHHETPALLQRDIGSSQHDLAKISSIHS